MLRSRVSLTRAGVKDDFSANSQKYVTTNATLQHQLNYGPGFGYKRGLASLSTQKTQNKNIHDTHCALTLLGKSNSLKPLFQRHENKTQLFSTQTRFNSTTTTTAPPSTKTTVKQEIESQPKQKNLRYKDKILPHEAPFNVKAARTIFWGSLAFGDLAILSVLSMAGITPFAPLWMGALSAAMGVLSVGGAMFLGFGATESDRAHLVSSSLAALASLVSMPAQALFFFSSLYVRSSFLLAQTIAFAAFAGVVLAKRPSLRNLKKDVTDYLNSGELVKDVKRFASFIHHAVQQRLYGLESVQYHQADVDYCYWNIRDNVPLANIVRPEFALKLVAAKLTELEIIPRKDFVFMDELRAYDLWEITSLKREKNVYTLGGLIKDVDHGLKHEIRGELEVGNLLVTFFAEKRVDTAAPLPEGSQPVSLTRYDEKRDEDLTLSYRKPEEPGLSTVEVVADAVCEMEGYEFKVLCVESNSGTKRISAPLSTPGRRVYETYAVQRGRYKSLKNLVAQS